MDIYLNFKNESREAIAFYEKVFQTEAGIFFLLPDAKICSIIEKSAKN
ncbi:TPA: hypothetical protein K6210_001142 [Enterococcus faecium]|nr:hypothetical protein [Enterococcus faecium]